MDVARGTVGASLEMSQRAVFFCAKRFDCLL
jgi:hypothetical protein